MFRTLIAPLVYMISWPKIYWKKKKETEELLRKQALLAQLELERRRNRAEIASKPLVGMKTRN